MRNAGLDEAQARIKIVRRNIKNLRYTDDTTLMAESTSPTLSQALLAFLPETPASRAGWAAHMLPSPAAPGRKYGTDLVTGILFPSQPPACPPVGAA